MKKYTLFFIFCFVFLSAPETKAKNHNFSVYADWPIGGAVYLGGDGLASTTQGYALGIMIPINKDKHEQVYFGIIHTDLYPKVKGGNDIIRLVEPKNLELNLLEIGFAVSLDDPNWLGIRLGLIGGNGTLKEKDTHTGKIKETSFSPFGITAGFDFEVAKSISIPVILREIFWEDENKDEKEAFFLSIGVKANF